MIVASEPQIFGCWRRWKNDPDAGVFKDAFMIDYSMKEKTGQWQMFRHI